MRLRHQAVHLFIPANGNATIRDLRFGEYSSRSSLALLPGRVRHCRTDTWIEILPASGAGNGHRVQRPRSSAGVRDLMFRHRTGSHSAEFLYEMVDGASRSTAIRLLLF